LRPQDLADTAIVVLEKSAADATFLVVVPGKANSMVDDEMRRRLAFIAPHARRALLVGKAMEQKRAEVAPLANALEGLSAAMFLVDACGRIVHTNAAGQDMLYANDFLRSADGRLAARDARVNQTLHEVFAASAKGDAGTGGKASALPLTAHDGERYVAHVLPLTSGRRRDVGFAYTAVAAVFVHRTALGNALDVVAQTFKLTPAELRVLHAIMEIGGVPETAAALGVAETTVKTHLYRLFDKTEASRQADLVKLVAGFSDPLVG
jgi:DNA-binding CsgD family transcriptional regulator